MRDIVVGTAGHVDHGKTLLVKAMTGTDADRWEEEKRRGITMDIGFATLATGRGTLHFVDLPGHERFIKNMLAGATGMDVCLLVVAADESVMPQTVEHSQILRLLGVKRGVVALNKVDLVDEETREMALLETSEFLAGLGFGDWKVLPVSALTGEGVPRLVEELYSLAEAHACPPPELPLQLATRPFRLPIDRVFPVKGFGTVVTGTCTDGSLEAGEQVEIFPASGKSRARTLQVFGRDVARIAAGQRAALNLPDLRYQDLRRGCLAATPGSLWPTHLLDVRVEVLPSVRQALKTGLTLTLHIHTQEVEAHLHLEGAGALAPGELGFAQLRMPEPVLAWPGDRFILRLPAPAGTVAGGEVLLVARRKARWRRPLDRKVSELLRLGDSLGALLVEAGPIGASPAEACGRLGVGRAGLEAMAQGAEKAGACLRWGQDAWWLSPQEGKAWLERASVSIKARQGARGPLEWFPKQEFLGRWQRILGTERAQALLEAMVAGGIAETEGDGIRPAGHRLHLSPDQVAAADAIRKALGGEGFPMRTGKELQEALGPAARQVLPLLVSTGEVIRFGGDFFMSAPTRESVHRSLAKWAGERGPLITVPEFKDLLGSTRKYVMPLLEHLDDLKWTRREGDGRRILVRSEERGVRREGD